MERFPSILCRRPAASPGISASGRTARFGLPKKPSGLDITTAGALTEYPDPISPWEITAGPDGVLWTTERSADRIARMTTAGVIANQYLDPTTGSGPDVIITGVGDGDLWFTEQFGTKIAQMTTAGVITEYPVPTPNSQPGGLTVGTDDALWFTEHTGDQIGHLTLTGVIAEYPVPTLESDPMVIEPGPDGALWFTEFYGNKIGRITYP